MRGRNLHRFVYAYIICIQSALWKTGSIQILHITGHVLISYSQLPWACRNRKGRYTGRVANASQCVQLNFVIFYSSHPLFTGCTSVYRPRRDGILNRDCLLRGLNLDLLHSWMNTRRSCRRINQLSYIARQTALCAHRQFFSERKLCHEN